MSAERFVGDQITPEESAAQESFKNRLNSLSDLLSTLQKNEAGRAIVIDKFGRRRLFPFRGHF